MNASKVRVASIKGGGVVEGGDVVVQQSSAMESRVEPGRAEQRQVESSRAELCKWPNNGRKSAPNQPIHRCYGMWHVAVSFVLAALIGGQTVDGAQLPFLRCVLWHASRVVSALRGNMFSTLAMAAAHWRELATGAGEGKGI